MKRFFLAILIVCLLSLPFFASSEALDITSIPFSNMTKEDLQLVIHMAREELAKRTLEEIESMIIVDTEDVFVYLDSNPIVEDNYDGGKKLTIYPVFENRSSSSLELIVNNVYVNKWRVAAYHGDLSLEAGKKVKSFMEIYDIINSIDELEEIEFDFGVWDNDLKKITVESIKKTITW